MNNNKEKKSNIYKFQEKNQWKTIQKEKQMQVQKILIMFLFIIIIIGLLIVIHNILQIVQKNEEYKKYQAQLLAIQKQEEEEKAQIATVKEKIRQERIPKLTEVGKENMKKIYHSETKRAFLTFDDGPSSVTSTILDVLKQEKIPATFFVLGSKVEAMPEMVKRIYEEGHYVANHGYSHCYSEIYSSAQEVLKEYKQCNDAVKNAIGVPEYQSHLFRYPGGFPGGPYVEVKKESEKLLADNGILYIDWNALSGDSETTKPTVEYELSRIRETVGSKNSVIILMHDAQAKKVTAEALPQIIAYLREQGYEFKNFYEIIK